MKKGDKVIVTTNDSKQFTGVVTSYIAPNPDGYGMEREGTVYVHLDELNDVFYFSPDRVKPLRRTTQT